MTRRGCVQCGLPLDFGAWRSMFCRSCQLDGLDPVYEDVRDRQPWALPALEHDWAAVCLWCSHAVEFRATDDYARLLSTQAFKCGRCGGRQILGRSDLGHVGSADRGHTAGLAKPVTFRERRTG